MKSRINHVDRATGVLRYGICKYDMHVNFGGLEKLGTESWSEYIRQKHVKRVVSFLEGYISGTKEVMHLPFQVSTI